MLTQGIVEGMILIFYRLPYASFIRENDTDAGREGFVDVRLKKDARPARAREGFSGSVQLKRRADGGRQSEDGISSEKERRKTGEGSRDGGNRSLARRREAGRPLEDTHRCPCDEPQVSGSQPKEVGCGTGAEQEVPSIQDAHRHWCREAETRQGLTDRIHGGAGSREFPDKGLVERASQGLDFRSRELYRGASLEVPDPPRREFQRRGRGVARASSSDEEDRGWERTASAKETDIGT
ncbi:uncharacterized protein M6B38_139560 [Iris pallida]|uniref:Uncharacterized protein n=1 Tax=Iris pallida TaxID=29817 RepID=A0AAX6FDQ2_IRIPA|nr:uncharacterized protein M6B38_139560 [Iris pallida]